jgi:hypothetical protein
MPQQGHNPNNYGRALMSAPPQAIAPNPYTNFVNVYVQIANKMGFQQQCCRVKFYSTTPANIHILSVLKFPYFLSFGSDILRYVNLHLTFKCISIRMKWVYYTEISRSRKSRIQP